MAQLILKARRVGQQIEKRDRFRVSGGNLHILEISIDVCVQIELPGLDKLHHRRPRKQLGDRPGVEERPVGDDRGTALAVGIAVSFGEKQLAIHHNGNSRAGNLVGLHLRGDKVIQKGFQLRRICWARGIKQCRLRPDVSRRER